MLKLFREIITKFALALTLILSAPAFAETVTTYNVKLPKDVMGLSYSTAWPVSPPLWRKGIVAGYSDQGTKEMSVMVFEPTSPALMPDEATLIKEREYFLDNTQVKTNKALSPKIVSEKIERLPGFPNLIATSHLTSDNFGHLSDHYYFVTMVKDRLVAIVYKDNLDPKTESEAKALISELLMDLQTIQ